MYEHIPADISDQIPERCFDCPKLAGRLTTHDSFLAFYERNKRTVNPFKRLGAMANIALSHRRLNSDVRDMLTEMRDCEGVLDYPLEDGNHVKICGITAREALASQIEE